MDSHPVATPTQHEHEREALELTRHPTVRAAYERVASHWLAKADPGPACYGRGGDQPTVTDANVLAGRINPAYFLGGEIELDLDNTRRAMQPLADHFGLSLEETAMGIIRLADASMTVSDIARNVRLAFDGEIVTSVRYGDEDVDFRVLFEETARSSIDTLADLIIPNARGEFVRLEEVAEFSIDDGPSNVYHFDNERAITITGDVVTAEGCADLAAALPWIPDILINNYGTAERGAWDSSTSNDWVDLYEKNVLSAAHRTSPRRVPCAATVSAPREELQLPEGLRVMRGIVLARTCSGGAARYSSVTQPSDADFTFLMYL